MAAHTHLRNTGTTQRHIYVWRDSSLCATWLRDIAKRWLRTLSHVMWTTHMCDMFQSYMCDATYIYVWHDSAHTTKWPCAHTHTITKHLGTWLTYVTWLIHKCNVTHATWLRKHCTVAAHSSMCDATYSHAWHDSTIDLWHDSFICVTRRREPCAKRPCTRTKQGRPKK